MSKTYLDLNALGQTQQQNAITVSTGAADGNKLAATDASGRFDSSLMPVGFGSETKVIVASEAIGAGDFVNIYSNAGVLSIRKADGSTPTKKAHGFVLLAVASAGNGTVYYGNLNTAQTGLTLGSDLFLSATVPGRATTTVPTTSGHIVQQLGVATSATEMLVEIQPTVQLA